MKSGAKVLTIACTIAVWVDVPFVPYTVIEYLAKGEQFVQLLVSSEVAVPFATSVTFDGFSEALTPLTKEGSTVVESVTLPAKPFRLLTVMYE